MNPNAYDLAVRAMGSRDPDVAALGDIVSDLIEELAQLKGQVETLRESLHDHQQLHRD